jgi:hypothetical protein
MNTTSARFEMVVRLKDGALTVQLMAIGKAVAAIPSENGIE